MPDRQIIALGGGIPYWEPRSDALERYILKASGAERPKVLFVPTASGDDATRIAAFYTLYSALECRPSHLTFFARTPVDLRKLVLSQNIVHVGGGNTRSMLAVWRDWGFAEILREAWERGIVLCGQSAGSICWFESGVTDSLADELSAIACLGFLPGSNCPHYDGEKTRRPAYHRLVAEGLLGDGYAADDGVGLHYAGDSLRTVVSARAGATAYRVVRKADGTAHESALEATTVA